MRILQESEGEVGYFNEILEHFTKMYKGIGFRWKLVERPKLEEEENLLSRF